MTTSVNQPPYSNSVPIERGNLHERMRFLLSLLHAQPSEWDRQSILTAAMDLETEVSRYTPVDPPYGQRIATRTNGG